MSLSILIAGVIYFAATQGLVSQIYGFFYHYLVKKELGLKVALILAMENHWWPPLVPPLACQA